VGWGLGGNQEARPTVSQAHKGLLALFSQRHIQKDDDGSAC